MSGNSEKQKKWLTGTNHKCKPTHNACKYTTCSFHPGIWPCSIQSFSPTLSFPCCFATPCLSVGSEWRWCRRHKVNVSKQFFRPICSLSTLLHSQLQKMKTETKTQLYKIVFVHNEHMIWGAQGGMTIIHTGLKWDNRDKMIHKKRDKKETCGNAPNDLGTWSLILRVLRDLLNPHQKLLKNGYFYVMRVLISSCTHSLLQRHTLNAQPRIRTHARTQCTLCSRYSQDQNISAKLVSVL